MADFESWITTGYIHGWCGPPVCATHDSVPTSAEEDDDWDNGGDPCVSILRLYEDQDNQEAVEANHSPSRWRATNRWGSE